MLRADAVVDLEEESLPDFRQPVCRLTGTAVRAVDSEGIFQFRSRWYADWLARASGWILLLMLASLLFLLVSVSLALGIAGVAVTREAIVLIHLPKAHPSLAFVCGMLAWPLVLAAMARSLRWPQFARPLAVTLVAFALIPIYLLSGGVTGAVLAGSWVGVIRLASLPFGFGLPVDVSIFLLIVVINFIVFAAFLGRSVYVADREFRRQVSSAFGNAPAHRALTSGLVLAASLVHAALLGATVTRQTFSYVSWYVYNPDVQRRVASAYATSEAGFRLFSNDPNRATEHFRRAIPLWESLVREVPSEPEYRINLMAAHLNLGSLLLSGRLLEEAREEFIRCSQQIDSPIPRELTQAQQERLARIRISLESNRLHLYVWLGWQYTKTQSTLQAEEAYRRALEILKASPELLSQDRGGRSIRERYEAAALNGLAWLSAVFPSRNSDQAQEAVRRAERAVTLASADANTWNTLALARYRAADWPGAQLAIECSMRLHGDSHAGDWVTLAMILFREGAQSKAARCYAKAKTLIQKDNHPDEYLVRLLDEADGLLSHVPDQ
jgi:tetratricopeptide (TPR) repeat protein